MGDSKMAHTFSVYARANLMRIFSDDQVYLPPADKGAQHEQDHTARAQLRDMMERSPGAFQSDHDVMAMATLYPALF